MRVVQVTAAVMVAAVMVAAASAQDQATTPKLSWKDRAKLDYQKRYEKYILHKKEADEENVIVGDGGSESNAIPLGTRINLPSAPPAPPSTRPPPPPTRPPPPQTRPPRPPTRPPPPSTPAFRPPPPTTTTTTTPPPPPVFRPAPPPTTTTTSRPPPPPPTPAFKPPPPPTTQRPTTQRPTTQRPTTNSPKRVVETTEEVPQPQVGSRGGFPAAPAVTVPLSAPVGGSASSGVAGAGGQQGTLSGTFSRPSVVAPSTSGGSFASSSATAFSSGGVAGGSSNSNAGTYSPAGTVSGTFSVNVGGASSASGSTTAVNKSPVALLGKVVQGIVRPITSILPAPLGPRGSNPGLVGGLVSGLFEELDGGLRAIYPGNAARRSTRRSQQLRRTR